MYRTPSQRLPPFQSSVTLSCSHAKITPDRNRNPSAPITASSGLFTQTPRRPRRTPSRRHHPTRRKHRPNLCTLTYWKEVPLDDPSGLIGPLNNDSTDHDTPDAGAFARTSSAPHRHPTRGDWNRQDSGIPSTPRHGHLFGPILRLMHLRDGVESLDAHDGTQETSSLC